MSVVSYETNLFRIKYTWIGKIFVIFLRWRCHEFHPLESAKGQDKNVLMNIDSLMRNISKKRLDVALPGDKLSVIFFQIKLFNPYRVSYWKFFLELKINSKDKNSEKNFYLTTLLSSGNKVNTDCYSTKKCLELI